MGARTLRGEDQLASDWKYVSIRRLGLFIEASIDEGTQWAVFEPNDVPLWAELSDNIGNFLYRLSPRRRVPSQPPAGGVLRSLRSNDDDPERHRQRPRDRPCRFRAGEAS